MAGKETIFFLDDDPAELAGFDDVQVKEPEKEPEAKADETPQEPEVKAEEVKKEPEKVVIEPDKFAETLKVVKDLAEQNKILMAQNQAMQEKLMKPKEPDPVIEEPEKPVFTAAQWEDDYQGCTEAVIAYNESLRHVKEKKASFENERKAKEYQEQIKNSHADSWTLSTEVFPELAEMEGGEYKYPELRTAWATIFGDPSTGYQSDPNGPLKATTALKKFIQQKGIDFKKVKEPKKVEVVKEDDKVKKLEEENARLSRVVTGTMHGSKPTGNKTKINLTAEQLQACDRLNCSPEAYAASLSALGGE